ncbi:MAG TPA: alcohol dehydrogenase catalytic domain-containing protein [Acidimicrobiia bacterium]|nr:alcohol dehydrogenase catalytic domain-containing protein [Acidimicrobiia bacterium]
MKAALLVEPEKLEVNEVPDPQPGPGEVRISVGGVGLCGSDLSVFTGRWKAPRYPWIMGHEAFGLVNALGPGVPPERIGQTVVVEPNVACFACDQCSRGLTSSCTARQSVGMNRPGTLAEQLVVPSRFAWSIPELPATDLVCVEPTAVVLAALRRIGTPLSASALIVGVGAQGLIMSLALLERGVAVYAEDVNPNRVALAAALGSLPTAGDPRRHHLVIDTVGSPSSMALALDRVEVGGTLLCLGLDSRPLALSAQTLVRHQLTLRGSLTYDHPGDFEVAIATITEGRLAPGRIVTDEYPLEEVQLAFERSGSARGKTWIRIAA